MVELNDFHRYTLLSNGYAGELHVGFALAVSMNDKSPLLALLYFTFAFLLFAGSKLCFLLFYFVYA